MDVSNVLTLTGIFLSIAGGLFTVYMILSSKIDRCYARMDENKEQYYRDFLLKSVHDESVRHVKELNEQKHESLNDLVKEKLDNLANEIKALREQLYGGKQK